MKKFYLESYGCSMNTAESEQISGFLQEQGFEQSKAEEADFLIINTCAVKTPTEFKMLKRIKALNSVSQKNGSKIVVCGCLPKVNGEKISEIEKNIIQCGPSLSEISKKLKVEEKEFSPNLKMFRSNSLVSIMPIEKGCLSNCSFCGTKIARGKLSSYPLSELIEGFEKNLLETKEIWLTGQDAGCYGKDIGTSLTELLKEFLKNNGTFRIRIGMMSPQYLKNDLNEYLSLFEDERLYRFFHLPIQSGSNKILRLMKRPYQIEYCIELFKKIRKKFPNATISTDIIAGFPQETEKDFQQTLKAIEEIQPDIVNISRYGKRPNTVAAQMEGQVSEGIKKDRSRILTRFCRKIAFDQNQKMLGRIETILISEKGKNNSMVGRTGNYKAVALKDCSLEEGFATAKITKAMPTYLVGEILKEGFS